jgi:hypothetical protein
MNREKVAVKVINQIASVINEYDNYFTDTIAQGTSINSVTEDKKILPSFYDTDLEVNLTPRECINQINYIMLLHSDNVAKAVAVNNYLVENNNAICRMEQKYKESRPFIAALRQILHFFRALFTGEAFKVSLGKSEATIFANRLRNVAKVNKIPKSDVTLEITQVKK